MGWVVLTVGFLCAAERPAQAVQDPTAEQLAWIRRQAIPLKTVEAGHGFDDLQPLKALIGDARIVALGESTHGTREMFQMKHRLVEFLASEMGFTIFSIEANMPEAYAVSDYTVRAQGDPRALLSGMYFWTWNTQEVLDMIEWMRRFNAAGPGRIEFTGFDMQTPDVAARIVVAFLKRAEPAYAAEVEKRYGEACALGGGAGAGSSFGTVVGTFPLEPARGRKIRFSGFMRTAGLTRPFAGLWCRVDGPDGVLAFDNMQDRAPTGNTEWKSYTIELPVAAEATNINFGLLHSGDGIAWFDDLTVEIDGRPFDTGVFDLDFEYMQSGPPRGFAIGGDQYLVGADASVFRSGKQSLRFEYRGNAMAPARARPGEVSGATREIVAHMESQRAAYAQATSGPEADWAIQNARVVAQCAQMHANEVSRDESMARNVQWILDHAPAGARIVLWAHNGHVQNLRGAMGSYLRTTYGKDYLVVGFACREGQYTAMGKSGLGDHDLQLPLVASPEWFLHEAGVSLCIVDIRGASKDDAGSGWLTQFRPFRSIGAVAMPHQFAPCHLQASYDGLIYIQKTSASKCFGLR